MKKKYFLYIALLLSSVIFAQVINIPDANFKANLIDSYHFNEATNTSVQLDRNHDGQIQQSEAAIVKNLDVSYRQISDLTGLESFPNLEVLICRVNNITNFNFSLPNLRELHCENNRLVELNVSGSNLEVLNCSDNNLISCNFSLVNIRELYCFRNRLVELNVSGSNLQKLNCEANTLLTLNVSNCPELKELIANGNFLTSLDLSTAGNLQKLEISSNFLQSINLTALTHLIDINCSHNYLTVLDLSANRNIESLNCNGNAFTTGLDLTDYTNLRTLSCADARLPSLNITGCYILQNLYCGANNLTALDLTRCYGLTSIDCQRNQISELTFHGLIQLKNLHCLNNNLTSLDVSSLPLLTSFSCESNQLTSLNIKNGSFAPDFSMADNPNLQYICADSNEVAYVQFLANQLGYNCTVDSSCVLETEAFDNKESFVIYPNPASTILNIQIKEKSNVNSVAVYNSLGQLVLMDTNFQQSKDIDVSSLRTGNYFVKVNSDSGTFTSRFIKQ